MDLQSPPNKKRKLENMKSDISTECDHCKVYVPILGQRNGSSKAQFDCKICNISVKLIVKPLVSDENENEIVRSFQENFEFEDGKTEIKDEPIDVESEGTQTEPTETHPGAAPKPLFSRHPEANPIPEGSAAQQQHQTEIMNEPIDKVGLDEVYEQAEQAVKKKINERLPLSPIGQVPAKGTTRCEHCIESFDYQWDLDRHMKVKHFGLKHQCQSCDKTFHYKENLNVHVANLHSKSSLQQLVPHVQVPVESTTCHVEAPKAPPKRKNDKHKQPYIKTQTPLETEA